MFQPTPGPPANHEPSPDEIRAACEQIQAEWDEPERRRRAGTNCCSPRVEVMTVRVRPG